MNKTNPKISFILPSPIGKSVKKTFDSIKNQSYGNIEIILVADDFKHIWDFYEEGLKRVDSDTDYVVLANRRDVYKMDYAEYMIRNANPEFAAKGCFAFMKNEENQYRIESRYERILECHNRYNCFFFSSILFSKEYICDIQSPEDKDLFEYIIVRDLILSENKIDNVPEKLIEYDNDPRRFDPWNGKYIAKKRSHIPVRKEYSDKHKIGLIVVATHRYFDYVKDVIASADKYFFQNSKDEVHFFIFTDKTDPEIESRGDVTFIHQNHMVWPGMTLFRYSFFYNNRDKLQDMDYLFYMDADMVFLDHVGREILGKRVGVLHPWQYVLPRSEYCYENENPLCTAYIGEDEGERYFFGTFQGGSRNEFLKMCRVLSLRIRSDIDNGIIAKWHDESQLNRYYADHPPDVVLDSSYGYPMDDKTRPDFLNSYMPKIGIVKKNNDAVRDGFKEDDLLERISEYYWDIYGEYDFESEKNKNKNKDVVVFGKFTDIYSNDCVNMIDFFVSYYRDRLGLETFIMDHPLLRSSEKYMNILRNEEELRYKMPEKKTLLISPVNLICDKNCLRLMDYYGRIGKPVLFCNKMDIPPFVYAKGFEEYKKFSEENKKSFEIIDGFDHEGNFQIVTGNRLLGFLRGEYYEKQNQNKGTLELVGSKTKEREKLS